MSCKGKKKLMAATCGDGSVRRILPLDFIIVGSNWSSIFLAVMHWFKYFAFVAQISHGLTEL